MLFCISVDIKDVVLLTAISVDVLDAQTADQRLINLCYKQYFEVAFFFKTEF